ncbi:FHA domain-containing protein [Microbacterium sp. B35-04]|uniref:FHA domain-containing protein FhaB/FipA n=1 Tax=Microbacterium sp. B35-04 TaxID=1961716 RepID=UPI0013D29AAC|nr:FHA domain-containing protein [Microbacterium sp. B35-04]KAF2411669.1 FHA domain-containing protein [Microbacterium sp. B35-04]
MSELTLLLLRIGFLVLLWAFVFAVVYSLRADLFGVKVRRMPDAAVAAASTGSATGGGAAGASMTGPAASGSAAPAQPGGPATTAAVSRIVITSGPKTGLELPLGNEPLTIGRSSESGLVIRDDYTSSHHARLVLWGDQWMIQDLDSTNGTWHDGARVTAPVPVNIGAPIKVGATTFELRK